MILHRPHRHRSVFISCGAAAALWIAAAGGAGAQQIGDTYRTDQPGTSAAVPAQAWTSDEERPPTQPDFLPLNPQHQKFVEELLDYWEQSSVQVKRCVCDFQLYEYNPAIVNWRNPADNRLAAFMIRRGQIRYSEPDKAHYESNQAWSFELGPQETPEYKPVENNFAKEKWLCDGTATYFYDFPQKRIYETVIPPEYRGQGLVNSPLPFLFGAKKEVILNRYWVRVITPNNIQDEYWLEAYPKLIEDARAYKKVQLVISRQDFLPSAIHVYDSNYDEIKNPVSRLYEFANRKINSQLHNFQDWMGVFIRPKKELGWEWVDMSKPPHLGGSAPQPINR